MNNILGSATVAAGFPMVKQGKLQVATVKKSTAEKNAM